MTRRIYYTDASCRAFEATVVAAVEHDGRPGVVLDQTAFYPTSGGQPFDLGTLADAAVVDVVDADDAVVHVVDSPIAVGTRVRGEIDWARRLDHMQQHTGQHLLSAAIVNALDNPTVSFHLGTDTASIDLQNESRAEELERAVDDANRVIWEDRPVSVRFASAEEAARLPLRKDPAREGPLRLIEIDGFDLSACGGTHVGSTGAIGQIAILGMERVRGATRVTFACGGRALLALRTYRDAVAGSVRMLSVPPQELPAAIERVQADTRDLRKTIARLQESLAVHEGARLVGDTAPTGGVRYISGVLDGWDAAGLKSVAAGVTAQATAAVALFSSAAPVAAVVACSPGVAVDANAVLRQLMQQFGGRGGGRKEMAQGGGLTGDPQEIAAAARALLEGRR